MKRCPRCSFIYEDDQRLCDLDGGELVQASGVLPPTEMAPLLPSVAPVKSQRNSPLFLPLAGAVMATALFSIYYFVPERPALLTPAQRAPATLAAPPQPAPDVAQAPVPKAFIPTTAHAASANNVKTIRRPALKPARTPFGSREPAAEPKVKTRPQPEAEAEATGHKKESRLGSILKKTGRLLKRPFKF
jgi:hypothetical protein